MSSRRHANEPDGVGGKDQQGAVCGVCSGGVDRPSIDIPGGEGIHGQGVYEGGAEGHGVSEGALPGGGGATFGIQGLFLTRGLARTEKGI